MSGTPAISFRELRESDALAAAELLAELGYPTDARTLTGRITAVRDSRAAEAFVAVDGSQRIAALASLHRLTLLTEDSPVAFVTSLVVAANSRGQGIGRLLVLELCRRARAQGCSRLVLTTHLRRAEAHAFYERVGFEFTGRRYVRSL